MMINHYLMLILSLLLLSLTQSKATNASSSPASSSKCEWSTYRPGPYFGLSSSNPSSPLFGLMWYEQTRQDSVKSLRHFVEISDNLTTFKYIEHNGCDYGSLFINDTEMSVSFNISFTYKDSNWITSIDAYQSKPSTSVVLLWYMTHDKDMTYSMETERLSGKGYDKDSLGFTMENRISEWSYPTYKDIKYDKEYFLMMKIPNDQLFDPSYYVIGELKDSVGIVPNHLIDPNDSYRSKSLLKGNTFVKQIFFKKRLRYDILFNTQLKGSNQGHKDQLDLLYTDLTNAMLLKSIEFNQIFINQFKGYNSNSNNNDYAALVKYAISSLNSNMIYMNGKLFILTDEANPQLRYSKERSMFAIAPDKTSHSRGFMWDEGFQLLILHSFNPSKSYDIFSSWFNGIEANGWLAREQSLDNESRSRAPPSSWAAIENVANPPSLYLYLEKLIDEGFNIPNDLIKQIDKNSNWFFSSQKTQREHIYAWKGKTDDYCLPSGLDDYPRSRLNGEEGLTEGHLDLQCWMILISRTMMKVYQSNKDQDQYKHWYNIHHNTNQSLYENYWDESRGLFDDFYYNREGVKVFSGHLGYINFFPLILSCLSEENSQLQLIKDMVNMLLKSLETPYGVSSLYALDSYYKKGQNYWTSPIWININYLILKTLNRLAKEPQLSEMKKDYDRLRSNLMNNMNEVFRNTGTLWENYDDVTGKGQYNHPFTGWSSLIVNIINESY